ncbi:MAG TPA: class I SAM-dependent methyltransferase [Lacipirellulaceae bacterium]|nr:class I SAM-dependent methyltransferase [Lacipirellulaceae bacterium]
MDDHLPDYAPRLAALHAALADDFGALVGQLPLADNATVLDAGCGDGFFTELLVQRFPGGMATALDSQPAYVEAARRRLAPAIAAGRCRAVQGDVRQLPCPDGALDAIWSAHSMQSYESIPPVLDEFHRALRPGGVLAVLESDNVHSIMLSWPPDLELMVRQAEHREIGDETSYIGAYFPRYALSLLRAAGFEQVRCEYRLLKRQGPPSAALRNYVTLYLGHLVETLADRLPEAALQRLRELATPDSDRFLPASENFFFGSLQTLATGQKRGDAGPAPP